MVVLGCRQSHYFVVPGIPDRYRSDSYSILCFFDVGSCKRGYQEQLGSLQQCQGHGETRVLRRQWLG